MTNDEIRKAGTVEIGADGKSEMVTVQAIFDGVRDNGHTYRAGDVFHMEIGVAQAHMAVNPPQVKLADKTPGKQPKADS